MKNSIILLCLLCSGYISAYAQTKPLKGRVSTANSGAPLAGVTVVAVQSQLSTTSDEQGVFELVLPNSETAIELSFVGYQKQLATIKGLTTIDVLLVPDDALLDEVVVTGYSAQKKADLTGAVSVIKISDVENVSSSNIMQSLTGRVAGMQVQSSGAPDGGATIRIRGIGTLGNNDPLYIIDGVPSKRSMNELNSNDIESIQVLKDASSSSIYGSRAANGVIIITTKRGKAGETKVDFRTSLKVQNYGKSLNLLNTWERGYVQWRAALNDGINPNFGVYKFKWHTENNADILDEVILPEYLDVNKTMFPADTDWQKEVGRTGLAKIIT